MRALPPFQLTIARFDAWNAGVFALGALAVAALAGWVGGRDEPFAAAPLAVLALGVAAVAGLVGGALRRRPANLSWDGRAWRIDGAEADPAVALDLGGWLLLRWHGGWLPIQRLPRAADWHALRCALYSPRPSPVRDGATDDASA